MDSSNPPDPKVSNKTPDTGMLGTLLTTSGTPSIQLPNRPPNTTSTTVQPGTPVIVTASSLLAQQSKNTPGRDSKPDTPSTGSTPLIIGLISSGPNTQAAPAAEKIKSPKKGSSDDVQGGAVVNLTSTPQGSGGFGAGKPKAFLSMMNEGAMTPPSAPGAKKQTTSAKKGQGSKSGSTGTLKTSSTKSKSVTPGGNPSSSIELNPTPRSSQRTVKRPRNYDDDFVDFEPPKSGGKKSKGTPKGAKSTTKKSSQSTKSIGAAKDLGRWRPTDDLMLISAVQQTNDLAAVYLGIKFSCRFTLREIEERWYALLYNQKISHIAIEAMRSLHPGVVTMALNNALWSQEEEAVLAKIPSSDAGHLETFQAVLKDNPAVFHTCRTATSLHHHWVLMGHYNLLNDQKVELIPPGANVSNFNDAEDQRNDGNLLKPRDVREEAIEQELVATDRQAKREILKLEEELPRWQTVLDTGSGPDFRQDEFAVFRGKVVEFRMAQKSVTFGRATPTNKVDFNLSLEGPAFKISRRQARVNFTDSGQFILHNEGRRPLLVDGEVLLSGRSIQLHNNQIIEVASMAFLVILNTSLPTVSKTS